MKAYALAIVVVIFVILLSIVNMAGCQNMLKHVRSSTLGLNRQITLYDSSGKVIREWTTRAKVEDKGGTCWFLTAEGKAVTISGTFVIEEK